MKTYLIIIIVLLSISASIVLAFYTYQTPTTTEIVVLKDITDNLNAQPSASEILRLYEFNEHNRWNGSHFLFTNVTDVSFNHVKQVKIDAANEWMSNELERGKQIKQFQTDMSAILHAASTDTVGRSHSSVYLAIASQLVRLSESKSEKKVLIIYSDLMENEASLSFYNPKVFSLLQSKPDSLQALLEGKYQLPSLTGIDVYLINQPLNTGADMQYRVVSEFYRNLLGNKGANVHVSANLLN